MRKIRKLGRTPGLFLRDYFFKRFAVESTFPICSEGHPLLDDYQKISFDQLMNQVNLKITQSVFSGQCAIDVSDADLGKFAQILFFATRELSAKVLIFSRGQKFLDVASCPATEVVSFLAQNSPIELLVTEANGHPSFRCRITRWKFREGFLEAVGQRVPLKRVRVENGEIVLPNRRVSDMIGVEPIDAVYTWVNAADRHWQEMLSRYRDISKLDHDRFHQSGELQYSIRALDMYAPWIRNVYVFSNCAPPSWFVGGERCRWIWHDEVAADDFLPTFNSHAIETMLHRIPGVADRIIYLNDDFFMCDTVEPSDFFSHSGRSCCRFEPYGTVLYLEQLVEASLAEEWQSAAVNSARVLQRDFGFFPTRMHQHVPYALDKNVYLEIERRYPDDVRRVRASRFRHHDDLSFTSFFYHHFAVATGAAEERPDNSFIARPSNAHRFKREMTKGAKFRFFCLNDGRGSAKNREYAAFKRAFLQEFYPIPSRAERADGPAIREE